MKVLLLGTAAGGGFPQWNCACSLCTSDAPHRTQDCVAISADGRGWYLLNASPDIRAQILGSPVLRAGPGPRETPLRGALITDAELDHTLGLVMLREAPSFGVWGPDAALHAMRGALPVGRYGDWRFSPVAPEIGGLRVSALPVSDKKPKYARDSTMDGPWVVAYRIEDPATGGVFVYAPCLAAWPPGFDEFTDGADYVLLDGTFYGADEMSGATRAGVGTQAQRAMGHVPISGADGSLARIRDRPGPRWAYTHLNNTNPALAPDSPEHKEILAAGAELPLDGTLLDL
ncbi:pyrroloquinoline quinone biosynthesis protein PqqB [Amycolatopsis albispora]|uniref:Coenzyme PQQ synthesis protein B n=1 Tax=Amycolatopsis albispora TaxID=1804986 RepID=A0A344LA93_9PSEU|nr:pyrroloquinoline quinone biosynthesis protein PqqB [Amycolatopsis albispora]AXB44967.1 pyrroloquinoline quinone biosynthesis protein B [Amycolatopsis albispora]